MCKLNFSEVIDNWFGLGAHLNARDRKVVSGLMKLFDPHGEVGKSELAELLDLAIEGRRRIKEHLKKMGSFEYYQTSFSDLDAETGEERFVGVPKQGGRELIATDSLAQGSVDAASMTADESVGLSRIEVSTSAGTGKLAAAGGVSEATRESINHAFSYLLSQKTKLAIGRDVDSTDFHVEVIDLLNNRVECEIGMAFFVAAFSAIRKAPVTAATLVLGDMSIQENLKPLRTPSEPLQVAKDNGAKRSLIPIENKREFLDVAVDIMEHVDPVFYGDPKTARSRPSN